MIKVDANWEKENIGSNVVEITIENDDVLESLGFESILSNYDYIVVKVPVNKTEFNWFLGAKGYTMIETQLKLSKDINDFDLNDRYIRRILPDVSYKIIEIESEIDEILNRINPNMFITDRISLDPVYGPEVGCKRYKNYIWNSFIQKKLEIIGILFKEKLVGFEMHTIKDGICYGKLGGIFNDVRIPGIGFLTACAPLLFAHERYGVTKFIPDISANNMPVLNLYDYFHFNVVSMTYVFVKHNKIKK